MHASEDSLQAHLSLETVGAYLDRALRAPEVSAVEAHLADCGSCRREVAEVRGVIRSRRRRTRMLVAAPTLVAVAVVLVVLRSEPAASPGDMLRSTPPAVEPGGVHEIAILAPLADSIVPSRALTFRWRAPAGTPATVRYLVTLTDDRGNLLWTGEVTGTDLMLPESIGLAAERQYLWSVDARLPDGRTITSGIHAFRTSP